MFADSRLRLAKFGYRNAGGVARVTLDGRYAAWTDRNKRFSFNIRYLPRDCTATIRAGQDVRPVVTGIQVRRGERQQGQKRECRKERARKGSDAVTPRFLQNNARLQAGRCTLLTSRQGSAFPPRDGYFCRAHSRNPLAYSVFISR